LRIYRIPRSGRRVVFLQHGLLDAAKSWLVNFEHQSLAYILYDAGYDVWIGNVRGNTYGKDHVTLSPKTDAFWKFSFDDMATYDVPALINYVVNITGQESIIYVGHSQGCMVGLICFGERPDIASKISLFVQMAPASNIAHARGALNLIAPFASMLETMTRWFGTGEFLPTSDFMQEVAARLCDGGVSQTMCTSIMRMLCVSLRLMQQHERMHNSSRIYTELKYT
jgi:pimeloyl-ACP methyl ester carboxylesterase